MVVEPVLVTLKTELEADDIDHYAKLYVLGGEGDTFNKTVNAYDPVTNTWTNKAPLPEGSALGTATSANGKLYYIEGLTMAFTEVPSRVYAYTP